jgi:hypothetical protein
MFETAELALLAMLPTGKITMSNSELRKRMEAFL